MNELVILTGPTAVGKTELSIALAKRIHGEIISADSIQVYKGMNIGSAKITKEEMQGVKHYLIDVLDPKDAFNVHIFQKMAKEAVSEIQNKGKIPIIVGGTGFYIQALLYDIHFDETDDEHEYRKQLEQIAVNKGNEYLYQMLKEIDPLSAEEIHFNNTKRVIRALEYYHDTGKTISSHNYEQRRNQSPYNFAYFVLNDKRELLYQRIEERVDIMLQNGLIEEVKELLAHGCDADMVSMQGIGYKEVVNHLETNISLEDTAELIKKNTRHFAKRQLTWFRREKDVCMINIDDFEYNQEKILTEILMNLKKRNIIKDEI
ncbi:MAG: tRNA (adenosine(37)-N6)-dimethylallyltransferase MiaA [Eubacterium sp.]|nr:tRNA (adenosine(37)-N6)-dimethylallyltransferase MiaA [Eubacterium sp.]